ncbi:cell division protein FtsQ [Microbacterium sp. YMB-B2]|uniref:Cell division protein FtsQ n=1 Tax=Microbacterium tenebrionis TaxID=2830665 RepID=A0A9X1LPG8_9MICO|nr:cell division protein FtsQ [Microbacterium tenebrionis]MCC2029499.1 cell division protein FtsQ [Microbacterium tenebrionis]
MTDTTSDYRREGALRGIGSPGGDLTTPQKLMIFVLSMALFGLANIILEIVPDISIGPIDVSVAYFVFVPLTMVALFSPFWAALGAPIGEIIFTDLLMGDFSGLSEVEGFIQMFLALYIAGTLIRNPRSRTQIWIGAITVVVIDKVLSAVVDLSKVWIGLEDPEFVEGLPQSLLAIEGIGLGVDIIISGILFGAIPAMWLIPALHGRIEPLLGVRPRVPGEPIPGAAPKAGWFVAAAVLLAIASFFFAFLEAWDVSIGSVETDLRGQFGDGFLWVSVGAIVVAVGVAVLLFRSQRKKQGN